MKPWHTLLIVALASSSPAAVAAQDDHILLDDRDAAPVPAADDSAEADAPAPRPAVDPARLEEIRALVRQLGDADFKKRDAASAKLREIGPHAAASLEEARGGGDPETAARADALLRHMKRRSSLWSRPDRPQVGGPALGQRMRVTVMAGGRQTDVFDGDLRIRINETPRAIEVKITGTEDGKAVSDEVTARDPAELRDKHPEAFELYTRYGGAGQGPLVNGRGGAGAMIMPGGGRIIPGPLIIRGGGGVVAPETDDIAELREGLRRQMGNADLPPDRRQDVNRRLDELEALQTADVPINGEAGAVRMRRYNDKSDELRALLAELKLPDPGDALPPPAKARLGIALGAETTRGPVVARVLPDSRGQKLGLQVGDTIAKINGERVRSAKDLRRILTKADKVTVEVERDGEPVKLEMNP